MSDRLDPALLKAVLAEPDSYEPRLVLADWCEENGLGERSEFIRVQCELGNTPEPEAKTFKPLVHTAAYHEGEGVCVRCTRTAECRYHVLRRRERELLVEHWVAWSPECEFSSLSPHTHLPHWKWRRGFLEVIRLDAADWLAHADALLAAHPVREVEMTTWPQLERREVSATYGSWVGYRLPGRSHECRFPNTLDEHSEDVLACDFLLKHHWPGIKFEFLPFKPAIREIANLYQAGALTINEVRAIYGMPPAP